MSVEIKPNYVVLKGKHISLQNYAQIRTGGGNIGELVCADNAITIYGLTSVWAGKYPDPADSCGGERLKDTMYDVVAPGCEDGSTIMIDDWTYMTKIEIP